MSIQLSPRDWRFSAGVGIGEFSYYFFEDSGPAPIRAFFFEDSGPVPIRALSFEDSGPAPGPPSKGLFSTNVCTFARTISLSLRPLTCTRGRF
jgi:hypothetical protein